MKTKFSTLILLLLFLVSCSENEEVTDDQINSNALKIMCIGDSRVHGSRPNHDSYRFEFWRNMTTTNISFDLVGPFKDDDEYPLTPGLVFDRDHAGIGGDNTLDIISRYDQAVSTGIPDIVLLGIGGNDLKGGRSVDDVIENIGIILDLIKAENSSSIVLLEMIAGANPNADGATELNSLATQFANEVTALANEKSNGSFKVVVVDMFTNFTNNASFYADDVHYSESGAKEIADRYFTAIQPFLN